MEQKKLSYFSWVPVIAIIMVIIGWVITPDAKDEIKTYSNDQIAIEFNYSGEWNLAKTDMGVDKIMKLEDPQSFIIVDTLKKYLVGGALIGHSDLNKRIRYHQPFDLDNYQEMNKEKLSIGDIPICKFSFTYEKYTDSTTTVLMKACEALIPIEGKGIVLIGFHAPESTFENYKPVYKTIMSSISIKN